MSPRADGPGDGQVTNAAESTGSGAVGMPGDIGIIDTMIGFPASDFSGYDFVRDQLKDEESAALDFPVEYLFNQVPKNVYGTPDPVGLTLHEMDRFGIERGLVGCEGDNGRRALSEHPDRFIPICSVDPNDATGAARKLRRLHDEVGLKAASAFPAGCSPPVPIDDPLFYPTYATCCDLDIPIFVCAGVPGPRLPFSPSTSNESTGSCTTSPSSCSSPDTVASRGKSSPSS